jgi:hypothetical protein
MFHQTHVQSNPSGTDISSRLCGRVSVGTTLVAVEVVVRVADTHGANLLLVSTGTGLTSHIVCTGCTSRGQCGAVADYAVTDTAPLSG